MVGPVRATRSGRELPALRSAVWAALCLLCLPALADPANPPRSATVERIADILEQIRANYVEPIDDAKLVNSAVNGVLRNLDPHSVYLDAEAFRELQGDSRGEYGGLGLEVAIQEGRVHVTSVFEGSPAARAGLRAGDVIVAVDGASTLGQSLEQIIRRVRGERGTQVELTIARLKEEQTTTFTVTRELIHGRSVWVSAIEPGYAYIRLSQFQVHTPENLVAGLTRFMHQDEARVAGIVLDLRDNPGGLLSAAIGVSAVFLPAGAPVVFTEGVAKDAKMRLFAQREDYLRYGATDHLGSVPQELKTLPMVVLVNGASASAAEIVAGALQDNQRATVLGTHTYGKGSVQVVIPFGDGTGMKLTTAYYHTPSGRMIQGKGVMPDVVVEGQAPRDPQAGPSPRPVALAGESTETAARQVAALCAPPGEAEAITAQNPAPDAHRPPAGAPPVDCQLERALQLLHGRVALTRS
jgi:carboxyl-terminal processing protease